MTGPPISRADLQPGMRVALLVPGSLAYIRVVMSLLADGIFPVPLDPRLTPSERDRILTSVRPDVVVTSGSELDALVSRGGVGEAQRLPLGRPMHVTSGTTGTPKGVYSGLLDPADAEALVAEERALWGFRSTDVNLVLSPLYHSAPLRFATGTLLASGRVVVPGGFDPARITAAIEAERPTTMFCVPAHLQRLFAHWDRVGAPDLSSFRLVAHAGAPCPPAVKRRLIELPCPRGGAAGGAATARAPGAGPGRAGSCGSTRTARSGAASRRTPGSPTSATRRRPAPPGKVTSSLSATSATSTTTPTCGSTAGETISSSAAE